MNRELHGNNLVNILRAIYADPFLRTILGFKGGTAAMLFYELPRFSVDLDFDLLDQSKKDTVFEKLKEILPRVITMSEAQDKHYTLFFLLRYGVSERTLKVEISKRPLRSEYTMRNHLGVSMLVMKQEDMFASKLTALLTRKNFATRDLFDVWFFLKENWEIDEEVLREKSGFSVQQALEKARYITTKMKTTELLAGLGELLDNKQKTFVRGTFQDDLIFLINLRLSNIENRKKHEA